MVVPAKPERWSDQHRVEQMKALISELCGPECAGRKAGTPGGERARTLIVTELGRLGLEPAGTQGYLQSVPGCHGANVIARVRGQGSLSQRCILVAAHYDHLGTIGGEIFPGADDNAAAVAILLETARTVAAHKNDLGREVLFCAFDAEEPPFYRSSAMGSVHFVRSRHVPIENIDTMICMDLMGHAVGAPGLPDEVRRSIFVLGAERSRGTAQLVDRVGGNARGVVPRRMSSDVLPALSDYYAFELERVPFLFLTSGRWKHYHTVTDTPEKLDYAKILATSEYLHALIMACSTRDDAPVLFDDRGNDDRAMLASVRDLARLVMPHIHEAKNLLASAEALDKVIARGGSFGARDRQALSILVMSIEEMLQ
jgi:Zn-dependent M28 family amino/carboxypeptidase